MVIHSKTRASIAKLLQLPQLALEGIDIALMLCDLFLERRQAVEYALVIALVSMTHGFLFGQRFLRVGQRGFFLSQFIFQYLAARLVTLALEVWIDSRKVR